MKSCYLWPVETLDTLTLVFLCLASFASGFIDAVAGGGGLIQTPVTFILLPQMAVSSVIGTLKIPAFSGTSVASRQYLKRVKMNRRLLLVMMLVALPAAYLGSMLLKTVSNDFMKPVLLVILAALAVYTFIKKDFGGGQDKSHSPFQQTLYAVLICAFVGFYDGFIGPGTGSFLVVGFVTLLGFDFLRASAHAKIVNLATNFGSIMLFVLKGGIFWSIAIPMAVCNALGGFLGAKMALSRGNGFVRQILLVVVIGTLIRFAYDVFMGK